ncbi:Bug family tripartite tricarboxylate transporter substrate binding protein [Achromobacter spanius]|uniref:Bug family tripartite tricarboxylate transporter substrate binding protein n=1 Tax=Achromobacter spanius TaxID=217203 RepID=UPI0036EC8B8B
MKNHLIRTAKAITIALGLVLSTVAQAADYPGERPVRIIVGAPPGGGGDTAARIVAESFAKHLKGEVIVENRAGAAGNIGAGLVARSAPDGYTIYFAYPSFVINPALMDNVPFDTKKDFRSLGKIADNQSVLLVHPSVPATDFKSFRELVLANPEKYSFAGLQGSSQYVAGLLLAEKMGAKFLNVPYKGNSTAMNDLMGGQVDIMFNTVGVSLPFIKSGKVKAIAVAGAKRSSLLPDLPTIMESGMPEFSAEGWYAFEVPAKTPDAIVDQATRALAAALAEPEVKNKLAALGTDVDYRSPKEFDAFVASELDRWVKVAKEANISGAGASK